MLITSPSSREAVALTVSDRRFGALEKLLGPGEEGERAQPSALDGSVGARQINVTWMALDLQPARTDRVFPGEEADTVWIHTATEVPDTYRGRWHRAAEPEELVALLGELGLMGRTSADGGSPALFPEPWDGEGLFGHGDGRASAAESAPRTGSASGAEIMSASTPEDAGMYARLDHWWWAIPGLAVGSALALAALRSGTGPGKPGRRQKFVDG
ncbi:hypothetical protein [Streptomyces sp. NPDC056796]|uniref:hypothetical protein n=1 Tax=unclassified Streptomyces TaxID=2593676 RepID=UPI0036990E7B